MGSGVNWDHICKFLAGECSAEEEEEIVQMMREDSAFADTILSAKSIWNASDFLKTDDRRKNLNLQAELRESLIRIRQSDELYNDKLSIVLDEQSIKSGSSSDLIKTTRPISTRNNTSKASHFLPYLARVAAIILFTLMGGMLLAHFLYVETENIVTDETIDRVINTRAGQMARLNLTDGSRVNVGAQSKMVLSESHSEAGSEKIWDFFLEGLAHFDLNSNANKSFVVHTQHAIVRILGTEFSVKAYPDDDYVQIIVVSGKVSVEADRNTKTSNITLLKDEMGLLNLRTGELSKRNVDADNYQGWMSGRLKFDDSTLAELSRELQRWFDVQIIIEDESLAEKRITAVVDNRSLHDVLNVIGIILDVSYVLNENENTVTLRGHHNQ